MPVEKGENLSDFIAEIREIIAEKRAFAEIAMRLGMHDTTIIRAIEKYTHELDMLEKELDWGEKYYS